MHQTVAKYFAMNIHSMLRKEETLLTLEQKQKEEIDIYNTIALFMIRLNIVNTHNMVLGLHYIIF